MIFNIMNRNKPKNIQQKSRLSAIKRKYKHYSSSAHMCIVLYVIILFIYMLSCFVEKSYFYFQKPSTYIFRNILLLLLLLLLLFV